MLRESVPAGIELATCKSQVQRPTANPPRKCVRTSGVLRWPFLNTPVQWRNVTTSFPVLDSAPRTRLYSVTAPWVSRQSLPPVSYFQTTVSAKLARVRLDGLVTLCVLIFRQRAAPRCVYASAEPWLS